MRQPETIQMSSLEADARISPPAGWALAGLSMSVLLSSMGTSIANVALPTLARTFDASFQAVQWVVLAYLLAVTTTVVGAGRLGDLLGRRRVLVGAIAVFSAASLMSGLAPTLGVLIAARALQGLGAAGMMSLTMALVTEVVPKAKVGRAMGLFGTTSAVGTALGPSIGGLLIAHAGWSSVFLVGVPVGVLALLLVLRFVPAEPAPSAPRAMAFDGLGTLLLVLTLAAYALAMTLGRGSWGLLNVALLSAAAVGAALFVLAETKVASPLLVLSMFRDPRRDASLAVNLLVSTVLMATLVVGPFYLSLSLGLQAPTVGLVMSIGPIASALVGVPAGYLVDRLGSDRVTLLALAGIALGSLGLALSPSSWGIAGYLVPIVMVTSHYAVFQAANNTSVMRDATPETRGVLSGMLNLSRNLGLITGASFMGALFAFAAGGSDLTAASPDAIGGAMRATFAVAAGMIVIAMGIVAVARAWAERRSGVRS